MEERGRVGVNAVVCFYDDVPFTYGRGAVERVFGGSEDSTSVRGQGCGETGRVEICGIARCAVDNAEVIEVVEHFGLSERE